MENECIIKYSLSSLRDVEYIEIYNDKVVYRKSTYKSPVKKEENILEDYKKVITDIDFIKNILLDGCYMPFKNDLISSYNKVKELESRSLTRPKNSSRKDLMINDGNLKIFVDMYIAEYGDIFTNFVEQIKKAVFTKINS